MENSIETRNVTTTVTDSEIVFDLENREKIVVPTDLKDKLLSGLQDILDMTYAVLDEDDIIRVIGDLEVDYSTDTPEHVQLSASEPKDDQVNAYMTQPEFKVLADTLGEWL